MYAVGYRSASSYLANGLLVRGMVQEDLHNLKMTLLSGAVESRGPTLSEARSHTYNYKERRIIIEYEGR